MSEILFKGKRKDNGEWVYGYYCKYGHTGKEKHYIIPSYASDLYAIDVIPETIGQYTGLTDKNGKKIFEGDIVEFYFFDNGHKNTKTMLIEWIDSGFRMRELFRNYRLSDDFTIIEEKIFTYRGDIKNGVCKTNNVYFVEVIGNICDNPELLKGEEENA